MPLPSAYNVTITGTDLLSWLFPEYKATSDHPLWIDAVQPTRTLSLAQLLCWVKRLGFGLYKLGLRENDVVLVISRNHIHIPVVYFGAPGFGYIFSGSNPAYGTDETQYQIENTRAKIIFVDPALVDTVLEATEKARFPKSRVFLFNDQECRPQKGLQDWRTMLGSSSDTENWLWRKLSHEEALEKTAVLNYSSGTTGLPKGVMISHSNIIANVIQSLFMRNLDTPAPPTVPPCGSLLPRSTERWIGFLPLYHAYGQLWSLAAAAFTRTSTYMMRAFSFPDFLRNIQRYRITHIQTAPPVVVMLAKRPEAEQYDLRSLKNILCGAAPLSKEVQNEVMQRIGVGLRIVQTWGMTELTCSGLHVPGLMCDESGAAGLCDPNSSIKLINDNGSEVEEDDCHGEIYYKGPNVCLGYWRNATATRKTFDCDGYLSTGDIAVRKHDRNGRAWYWIVDRKKELIKVKGFQVAPAELEAVLLTCTGVGDAAVVGLSPLKEDHGEERPRAYVVLKDGAKGQRTEQSLEREVEAKVARHKWLTGGVKFVEEVPKSPSGKIQRVVMRQWAKRDAKVISDSVPAKL